MLVVIIISILILIFALVMFIPIVIRVYLNDNKLSIKLILLKVIKIKIKEKTTFEKLKKEKIVREKVSVKKIIKIVKEAMPGFRYLISKTTLNIDINGSFGFSTPDRTALTYGIVNMIIYNLDSLLQIYLKKYRGSYNINPDFSNEKFEYSIYGEVKLKLFNISVFLLKMLKLILKYKKYIIKKGGASNDRSSDRRIDENYNG